MSRDFLSQPIPVSRALRKLGRDIRDARRRRRIPSAILAERTSVSRMTLFPARYPVGILCRWSLAGTPS